MARNRKSNASRKNKNRQARRNLKQKYATHPSSSQTNTTTHVTTPTTTTSTATIPPPLESILAQADTAMEVSDVQTASQLYQYALQSLRQTYETLLPSVQSPGRTTTTSPSTTTNSSSINQTKGMQLVDTVLTLSKVLTKLAEGKVSMGDVEGAKQDFTQAMTLLVQQEDIVQGLVPPTTGREGDTTQDAVLYQIQWKEAKANLCLYMGQLSNGKEALECFQKAVLELQHCVEYLERQPNGTLTKMENNGSMDDDDDDDDSCENNSSLSKTPLVETRQQLCGAYCSISELYLTDLCFESNAEMECEAALTSALALDDPNHSPPDAVQAMANLRLSQNRGLEAMPYILDAYQRMKKGCEATAHLVGIVDHQHSQKTQEGMTMEESTFSSQQAKEIEQESLQAADALPGFEFRCQSAKLLLECSSLAQEQTNSSEQTEEGKRCVEAAIYVLGSLLAENDEVAEIWFLLGCAFSASGPKNVEAAREHFQQSLEMLQKVEKNLVGNEFQLDRNEIKGQMKEVENRLEELNGEEDETMDES